MKHLTLPFLILIVAACGGQPEEPQATAKKPANDLTPFQLEHGIGPVTSNPELTPISPELVANGAAIFNMKCVSCHVLGERFVGPDLRDVTERRSAAFIQNMILNPSDMVRKHPEGKKLLAEFMTPMPYQNVTEEDARALLEYLRSVAPKP
jgi:mono/diheme cytochrome c family protein